MPVIRTGVYPQMPIADHREIQIVYCTGRQRPSGSLFLTPHMVRGGDIRYQKSCGQTDKKTDRQTDTGRLTDQQVWFPVDFKETFSRKFSRICSFIDIYRAGSLTPGITLILFTQAIAQLKNIYQGLIEPLSINPGLLQDVYTDTLWSTRILSQPENFQETLLISSRFPGFPGGKTIEVDFQDFQVLDTLRQ